MIKGIKKFIRKNRVHLGIYFDNERIKAYKHNYGTIVDDDVTSIIHEIWGQDIMLQGIELWKETDVVLSLIAYCANKGNPGKKGLEVLLGVPVEITAEKSRAIMQKAFEKVPGLKVIHVTENIVAAAIGASEGTVKLVGPKDVAKRLFVFSDRDKTYISLLWSGNFVDFLKIDKGYNSLDNAVLGQLISEFLKRIPREIPPKYTENDAMKPFLSVWYDEIEKEVYIAIPGSARMRVGNTANGYELIYMPYNENLVINGIAEIIDVFSE